MPAWRRPLAMTVMALAVTAVPSAWAGAPSRPHSSPVVAVRDARHDVREAHNGYSALARRLAALPAESIDVRRVSGRYAAGRDAVLVVTRLQHVHEPVRRRGNETIQYVVTRLTSANGRTATAITYVGFKKSYDTYFKLGQAPAATICPTAHAYFDYHADTVRQVLPLACFGPAGRRLSVATRSELYAEKRGQYPQRGWLDPAPSFWIATR